MSNIYLYYGEEKYDLNIAVNKIKNTFDKLEIGVNLFYITSDNINEISTICQGVTFFGNEKLVIIKDTKLKFNTDILINQLEEGVKVIIIEESVDKRTSEYKNLSKIAECVEFKHLDTKQMIAYIIQILKKYNITISYEDAEYMQSICGDDKTNNVNELQKLVVYLDNNSKVTKDIIDKVCAKTLSAKIFDVLNKIINKEKVEAIKLLDELLKQKEPIVKIYIMLYKQIKQMYMIKYLKERNEPEIATVLGIHPFVFKNLNKACDKYKLEDLRQIIYSFDEYDEKTKLGEMNFEIGLKKIVCTM